MQDSKPVGVGWRGTEMTDEELLNEEIHKLELAVARVLEGAVKLQLERDNALTKLDTEQDNHSRERGLRETAERERDEALADEAYMRDGSVSRLAEQIATERAQSAVLRAALEWYGTSDNYMHTLKGPEAFDRPVVRDAGSRARATLSTNAGRDVLEALKAAEAENERLREALEKAAAFKAYVHKRLDDAGVPVDPDPEHNAKHGCRIEGRLNYALAPPAPAPRSPSNDCDCGPDARPPHKCGRYDCRNVATPRPVEPARTVPVEVAVQAIEALKKASAQPCNLGHECTACLCAGALAALKAAVAKAGG